MVKSPLKVGSHVLCRALSNVRDNRRIENKNTENQLSSRNRKLLRIRALYLDEYRSTHLEYKSVKVLQATKGVLRDVDFPRLKIIIIKKQTNQLFKHFFLLLYDIARYLLAR